MFKNMKIRTKILIAFTSVAVIAVAVIGFFAFTTGSIALEEESFNKLTAVREMKANQIEDYFQLIENQVVTMSEDRMIVEAMRAFDDGLHSVEDDLSVSNFEMRGTDTWLEIYYEEEFLPRLIPNLLKDVSVDDYWPEDKRTRILQNLYIASNPFETGSKHMLENPDDGSSYSMAHETYHPIIRDYLEKFGYYDIFLVDVDTGGHIAYSVFKEVDYGTSLVNGPYADTNFAEAYNAARAANDKDFVKIVDYEPYDPSYHAPAAFIASPIFDGNEKIGVLVFQMPIDRINGIMTNDQNWKDVGLGESGETYLVGQDFKLRNQSRFLIEDSDDYFNMIEEIGVPLTTRGRIRNLNSTIGLQDVKTDGTKAALSGLTDSGIFPDYRGVPVLSSYKPLNIRDMNWVIMSEIDQQEAFAAIRDLGIRTAGAVLFLIGVIVGLAVVFSGTITKPLEQLRNQAIEILNGDLDTEIGVDSKDEIGELGHTLNVMRLSNKGLIEEMEEINQNLEAMVLERTRELEASERRSNSIVELASEAIIVINERSEVILWNRSAEDIFGFSSEEITGKGMESIVPAKYIESHKDAFGRVIQSGELKNPGITHDVHGLHKDGTEFPIDLSVSNWVVGGRKYFSAIIRDTTERKQAEAQLRFLSEALKSAANGVAIIDLEDKIQWVNPSFENMTGYTFEEVQGNPIAILNSGKHSDEFYEKISQTVSSGKVWRGEIVQKRKDGGFYTEELSVTPIVDEDEKVENFVSIRQDITQRKELERQLEIANERMSTELNFARDIQMSMLPLIFPAFPTRKEVSVYATLEQAREVGGDFYDFYFIDDDHLCFVIGDVSGKGAPGALLMAVSKTLIKSRAADDLIPASILTHVNDELSQDNQSSMFVTVFLGIINVKTGEMEYTNAGHNPPYIKRSDGTVEKVSAFHGPVIGAMPGMPYKQDSTNFIKGDTILLYTDGVTEMFNVQDELYSEKRLEELLADNSLKTTENIVNSTVTSVREFQGEAEQADDVTILAVQYNGLMEDVEHKQLEIAITNRLEEIGLVEEQYYEFAEENGIPDADRQRVSIVLDEMLNNIVSYAYPDGGEHEIEVDIDLSGNRLVVTVKDDGIPFNPFTLEEPDLGSAMDERKIGGLGIHLVRSTMDEYLYQRNIDKNVVTLVKFINR